MGDVPLTRLVLALSAAFEPAAPSAAAGVGRMEKCRVSQWSKATMQKTNDNKDMNQFVGNNRTTFLKKNLCCKSGNSNLGVGGEMFP